jgi:translocation and assembly module TamB
MVRTLKAQLGGGELLASGEWADAPATTTTPAPQPAWKLQATLQHVNPALLHSQLAPLPLDGKAEVRSQGAAIAFDANVQAARNDASAKNNPLGQLRLRDASATGSWNAEQAGGTLVLSALRVRTDDAELTGQLEAQPSRQRRQRKAHAHRPRAGRAAARRAAANQRQRRPEPARPRHGAGPALAAKTPGHARHH